MEDIKVQASDLDLTSTSLLVKDKSIPLSEIQTVIITSSTGQPLYTWVSQDIPLTQRPHEIKPDGTMSITPTNIRERPLDIQGNITLPACTFPMLIKQFLDITLEALPMITFIDIALDNKKMLGVTPYQFSVISDSKLDINGRLIELQTIRGIKTSSYEGDLAIWVKEGNGVIWELQDEEEVDSSIEPFILQAKKYSNDFSINIYY
jgi:hypothetical protein